MILTYLNGLVHKLSRRSWSSPLLYIFSTFATRRRGRVIVCTTMNGYTFLMSHCVHSQIKPGWSIVKLACKTITKCGVQERQARVSIPGQQIVKLPIRDVGLLLLLHANHVVVIIHCPVRNNIMSERDICHLIPEHWPLLWSCRISFAVLLLIIIASV